MWTGIFKTEGFSKIPYKEEGPVIRKNSAGEKSTYYMYGHFVYIWPDNSYKILIGHGTTTNFMPLQEVSVKNLRTTWGQKQFVEWARGDAQRRLKGKSCLSEEDLRIIRNTLREN